MSRMSIARIPVLSASYRQWSIGAKSSQQSASPELNDKVSLYHGDITKLEVSAIVNAANKSLMGGGGVDGAIHRAAGPELVQECRGLQGCETGAAKITKGYKLPAQHVIHTVGPVYYGATDKAAAQLRDCYLNSLRLAKEHKLKSIAFPSISTGVYGYPIQEATTIALTTVRKWLEENRELDRVIFCVYSKVDEEVYEDILPTIFPPG